MRRARALAQHLLKWNNEVLSRPGITVTSSDYGYRSVTHSQPLERLHSATAAPVQTLSSRDLLFPYVCQGLFGVPEANEGKSLGRPADGDASSSAVQQLKIPEAHHSAIAHEAPFRSSSSGDHTPPPLSFGLSRAALNASLQERSLLYRPPLLRWDQEAQPRWFSRGGRSYSTEAVYSLKDGAAGDTVTVGSKDHQKRCAMCLKLRHSREFQPRRSSPDGMHHLCRGCASHFARLKRGLATEALEGQAHCDCCGETKDKALFGREDRKRSGVQSRCRACVAEDYRTRPNVRGRSQKEWRPWAEEGAPVLMRLLVKGAFLIPTEKVCYGCGKLKAADQFGRMRTSYDRLRTYCKPCMARKNHTLKLEKAKSELLGEPVDNMGAAKRWLLGSE